MSTTPVVPFSDLPRFADVTLLPNSQLSTWLTALSYAIVTVRNRIEYFESNKLDCTYEQQILADLQDMNMFVGMSHEKYLESLGLGSLVCKVSSAAVEA